MLQRGRIMFIELCLSRVLTLCVGQTQTEEAAALLLLLFFLKLAASELLQMGLLVEIHA